MIISRLGLSTAVIIVMFAYVQSSRAEEEGGSRGQLDHILAILRIKQESASKACLTAMSQVHATEQQVKDHQNDTGNHPDLDIAHDVLDSDYQNGAVICGADAERICRQNHDLGLLKPCNALLHGSSQ